LLQQQRLGNPRLVILVQDVGDQVGPEVAAPDRQHAGGKRRQHGTATGQSIARPQVAGVVVVDDEFLNHVRFVAPEGGADGQALGMQRHLLMDVQFRRLGPLGGTRPLAAFGRRGPRRPRFQKAGLEVGTRPLSLEKGDLIPQLLDGRFLLLEAVLLDAKDPQQRLDERRAFLSRDVGKFQLHTAECRKTRPDQLRQNPRLLRSYPGSPTGQGHERVRRVRFRLPQPRLPHLRPRSRTCARSPKPASSTKTRRTRPNHTPPA